MYSAITTPLFLFSPLKAPVQCSLSNTNLSLAFRFISSRNMAAFGPPNGLFGPDRRQPRVVVFVVVGAPAAPGDLLCFFQKLIFFFLSSLLVWRSLRLYEGKSVIGAQCVISIVFRVTKPSRGAINAISGGRPQIYSPLMACRTHCLDGVGTCYYILLL